MRKSIPNFFLIGPAKAGTTAVAEGLALHPEIFISEPKEPFFFMYQGGNPYGLEASGKDSLAWYLSLYQNADGHKALGDATTYYICLYHCAAEIYEFNPDAKIIAILRNPVFRAFSMYRYWHMNSPHPISTDDFVDCFHGEKLRHPFEIDREIRIGHLKDPGLYGKHLKRYFQVFPRDQIKIVFYDELVNDPSSFYKSLHAHLGVTLDKKFLPENQPVNVTVERKSKTLHHLLNRGYSGPILDGVKKTPIGAVLRSLRETVNAANVKPKSEELKFPAERYAELIAVYRDDIAQLEDLLGVDLEGWRNGEML